MSPDFQPQMHADERGFFSFLSAWFRVHLRQKNIFMALHSIKKTGTIFVCAWFLNSMAEKRLKKKFDKTDDVLHYDIQKEIKKWQKQQ